MGAQSYRGGAGQGVGCPREHFIEFSSGAACYTSWDTKGVEMRVRWWSCRGVCGTLLALGGVTRPVAWLGKYGGLASQRLICPGAGVSLRCLREHFIHFPERGVLSHQLACNLRSMGGCASPHFVQFRRGRLLCSRHGFNCARAQLRSDGYGGGAWVLLWGVGQ